MILTWRLILYFIFAGISIFANMLAQSAVFFVLPGDKAIIFAMPIGACCALLLKYFLDRRFIFRSRNAIVSDEFLKYAMTGSVITGLFFAIEYFIWSHHQTAYARNVGIIVGMLVGYSVKFILDLKFTFQSKPLKGAQ